MDTMENIVTQLIEHIDDPLREGLSKTPTRYKKFLNEFLQPEPFEMTIFDSEGYDEMVVVTDISFYSLCEHHLLPFFGRGSIGYIPRDNIVGLSKLPRILDHFSRRLQNQERITTQVAELIEQELEPKGTGVILTARHMCMEMRGVKKEDCTTTTSCLKGAVKTNVSTRAEFMQLSRK